MHLLLKAGLRRACMFDRNPLTNSWGVLTDSNGIAAHLLLEPMPELRWQDIPLRFILNFINIIPHMLIWQSISCIVSACGISVLRCLCQAQHSQLRSRAREQSKGAEQGGRARGQLTDCLALSRDLGEILFYRLLGGREGSWQACSQVLQIYYGWTLSYLCTRHQHLPPI